MLAIKIVVWIMTIRRKNRHAGARDIMRNLILPTLVIGLCSTLAACQTAAVAPQLAAPEPLQPAPVAPVSATTLSPVGAAPAAAGTPAVNAAQAGAAANGQVQDLQAIPSITRSAAGVTSVQTVTVSPSIDFGRNAVLGAWNVSTSADSCALNLSLTTWTGGFRASTRKCSTDQLLGIGAWNVAGKQLSLFNKTGGLIARLVASGDNRFDGTTEAGGSSISVFR